MDPNTLERLEVISEDVEMADIEKLFKALYSLKNVLFIELKFNGDSWSASARVDVSPPRYIQRHLPDAEGAARKVLQALLLDCEEEANGLE